MKMVFARAAVTAALWVIGVRSWAGCGLGECRPADEAGRAWTVRVDARWTSFGWAGLRGDYRQITPRVEWARGPWTAGAWVPIVNLDVRGAPGETGLGNAVLALDRRAGRWTIAQQFELATGDDDRGLASSHAEWMPLAAFSGRLGSWRVTPRGGYRHAFENGGGHGHGPAAPLLVNPHDEGEVVYRLDAGRGGWSGFIDGQHVVKGETKGRGFLSAGAEIRRGRGRLWVEAPLTAPRRFEARAGVGAAF